MAQQILVLCASLPREQELPKVIQGHSIIMIATQRYAAITQQYESDKATNSIIVIAPHLQLSLLL
jgi:hypothetical protein